MLQAAGSEKVSCGIKTAIGEVLVFDMEGSHSGLVRRLGKAVREKSLQEFESLTLRQVELARRA